MHLFPVRVDHTFLHRDDTEEQLTTAIGSAHERLFKVGDVVFGQLLIVEGDFEELRGRVHCVHVVCKISLKN